MVKTQFVFNKDLTKMFKNKQNNQCFKMISLFKVRISTILLQYFYSIYLPGFELKIMKIIDESLYY